MTNLNQGAAKEHRTVSRVTSILEAAAANDDGVRVGELAALLDAPKSSVHGLAKGLVATGYLKEEAGSYTIGPAVSALLAPARPSLQVAAVPAMQELQKRFGETVMLCTAVGDSVVYIETVESTQLIRYSAPLRHRRPMYPTSSGKCFLALGSARFRRSYLDQHFDGSRREEVEAELEQVAREGVAFNRGETLHDVSAASAPIYAGGRVVACVAVAGPTERLSPALSDAAEALRESTARIGELLA